ncbi:MAG: hypothetical protein V3W34_17900, partial [Phycisphaerae bacterium]
LYVTGQTERARRHLRKTIELKGGDMVTYYLLGRLSLDDGEQATATSYFRVALKASDASSRGEYVALCHYYLARALNADGYLTASIEAYRSYEGAVADLAADEVDEPELATLLRMNRGRAGVPISVAYEKLGRFGNAADALASAVEGSECDADTRARLARLLSRCGRIDEALEQARLLLDDPDRAVGLLVEIHERSGHPQRVLDDVKLLYQAGPGRIGLVTAYSDTLLRFDRLADAQRVLSESLDQHPEHDVLYWRLCEVFALQQQWPRVLETAAAAIRSDSGLYHTARRKVLEAADHGDAVLSLIGDELRPRVVADDYAAAYLLAALAQQLGRTGQAESLFGRALAHRPEFVPARVALGEILLNRFAWAEVIELASADPEQLQAGGRLQRLCGRAYAALDDFDQAETHLGAAIRLNRADTVAMAVLAQLLRDHGKVRRAQRQYESILKVNPLDEASREKLFEIYLFEQRDRFQDAAHELAELRRLSASGHRIARCTARLDRHRGKGTEAWEDYRKTLYEAIEHHGPDAQTYELIAQSYLQTDEPVKATEAIDQALALDAQDAALLLGRVFVLNASLEYAPAIETMRRLVRRHPHRMRWIHRLVRMLIVDQRFAQAYDLAAEQLQRPDLSEEDTERFRRHVRESLRGGKRHDERIALLRQWRDTEPEVARWTWLLVDAYNDAEQHDQAIALARAQYAQTSDRASLDALWMTLIAAKRYDQAQQVILENLEDDPDNEELIERLIGSLTSADRHDDALELIQDLEFRMSSSPGLRELKINVFQDAGRHDEAIKLLNKWFREVQSRAHHDKSIDALQWELASALVRAGRLDEAVSKLRRWADFAETTPARFRYLTLLSICFQYRAEPHKALESLEEAFALRDQVGRRAVGIHNDLGYSLADAGLRLDEAESMIRYDLARFPTNGAYLDSFGWVLYKKSEFERALRWLEKAANVLAREDPVVYDHLGDVLWRLREPDQAVKHWDKAVELTTEELKEMDRLNLQELLDSIKAKIEAHKKGGVPEVAPVGQVERAVDSAAVDDSPR